MKVLERESGLIKEVVSIEVVLKGGSSLYLLFDGLNDQYNINLSLSTRCFIFITSLYRGISLQDHCQFWPQVVSIERWSVYGGSYCLSRTFLTTTKMVLL